MKLRICGIEYDVTRVQSLVGDEGSLGTSSLNSCKIKIDRSLKKDLSDSVIIHEVIEQIIDLNEIERPDHKVITSLATSLYTFLIDNPEYILELLGKGFVNV